MEGRASLPGLVLLWWLFAAVAALIAVVSSSDWEELWEVAFRSDEEVLLLPVKRESGPESGLMLLVTMDE